jgi:hypothetical protein
MYARNFKQGQRVYCDAKKEREEYHDWLFLIKTRIGKKELVQIRVQGLARNHLDAS